MKTATALLALALMLSGCLAEVPPESSQENPDHRPPWVDCDRDTGIELLEERGPRRVVEAL